MESINYVSVHLGREKEMHNKVLLHVRRDIQRKEKKMFKTLILHLTNLKLKEGIKQIVLVNNHSYSQCMTSINL